MTRAQIIREAKAASERAREHLTKHHPPRSWTETMRALRVALDECVGLLERETEHGSA